MVDGPWIDDWMSHEQNNKCPQQKKMTKCEEEEDGTFDRSLSTMVSCVSFPFVAACVRLLFSQKFLTHNLRQDLQRTRLMSLTRARARFFYFQNSKNRAHNLRVKSLHTIAKFTIYV